MLPSESQSLFYFILFYFGEYKLWALPPYNANKMVHKKIKQILMSSNGNTASNLTDHLIAVHLCVINLFFFSWMLKRLFFSPPSLAWTTNRKDFGKKKKRNLHESPFSIFILCFVFTVMKYECQLPLKLWRNPWEYSSLSFLTQPR